VPAPHDVSVELNQFWTICLIHRDRHIVSLSSSSTLPLVNQECGANILHQLANMAR